MANANATRVRGLRESESAHNQVKIYRVVKDTRGKVIRDKAGNPVLGRRL